MAEGRTLSPGAARGSALVLDDPLSFWGGVDPDSGRIIDARHPQVGANVAGRVLVLASGRGSSSSSSVLAECVRAGTAPAAVLLLEPDPIMALGAIVARELYGSAPPVVVLSAEDHRRIRTGDGVVVDAGPDTASVVLEQGSPS
jgi:predicted aconitase with swiveling domain